MSFSPQLFLSNIKAKDGLARPSRYEVILPIPSYINDFIETSALAAENVSLAFEELLNSISDIK